VIDPTVAVVWFEKKPGRPESPIMPTPIAGRHATILVDALARIDIPAFVVRDEAELLYEMVRKNVYIIAMNVGGLVSGGTMRDLWYNHRELAENVARDVISVQEWLTGSSLDADRYVAGLVQAIDARPDMGATGRSAPARLARALNHADTAGLAVPSLRKIAATIL
jgi:hypothetical protein